MTHEEKAKELFLNGYNCSQAVFNSYADDLGLDSVIAKKTASAFGAGMGRTQSICGAVTGALMVIGMAEFDDKDVSASKGRSYQKAQQFMDLFEEEKGSLVCSDILACDLTEAGEQGLFQTTCLDMVLSACRILDERILEK